MSRLAGDMDGVFTLADFRVLYAGDSEATRFRKMQEMVEMGELVRVKKGVYARPDADLRKVSQRIAPESIVSLGTVLAEEGVIGSIPGRRVWAVRVGTPRRYVSSLGVIEHLSIAPDLMFGWEWREGIRRADVEKAYLDAWYFQFKGRSLPFDLLEDTDSDRMDSKKITKYLQAYDRRFKTYFCGFMPEYA